MLLRFWLVQGFVLVLRFVFDVLCLGLGVAGLAAVFALFVLALLRRGGLLADELLAEFSLEMVSEVAVLAWLWVSINVLGK